MSNEIKSNQLGMPFGTASSKLRKQILFNLLKKYGENICFKCKKEILNEEELSIEHKEPWLHSKSPKELFFDINNIAFSHLMCNITVHRTKFTTYGTSKYKGVYFDKTGTRKKRWRAVISEENKITKLGRFLTEKEAAIAYNNKAIELYGERAILNKIMER